MKNKKQLFFILTIAAALSCSTDVCAQGKAPAQKSAQAPTQKPANAGAKPAAKPDPKKPNRQEITNRIRKQYPMPKFPIKAGGKVSFKLRSGATVRGKLVKITPVGLRINDGKFEFLQKKNTMPLEERAKFYKEDYELFIKTKVDREMNPIKLDSSGNKNSVAKPGDKRFPKTKPSGGMLNQKN